MATSSFMQKSIRRALAAIVVALVLAALTGPAYATNIVTIDSGSDKAISAATAPSGANLTAAKTKYGVSDGNIVDAATLDDIKSALSRGGSVATSASPYIVHVPSGSYSVGCESKTRLQVPSDVILVAEEGVKFVAASKGDSMVVVKGVVYGGSYDGGKKTVNVIKFSTDAAGGFSGNNGRGLPSLVPRKALELGYDQQLYTQE